MKLTKTLRICNNLLQKTTRRYSTKRDVQEIRIPTPLGDLAGKWWGPEDKKPILALHGWQDNCGTFDTLIPHLRPDISILALDIPGHGFSFKLPQYQPYMLLGYSFLIKYLRSYFNWDKVTLMGHSISGVASFQYSSMFPTEVDHLILMDGLVLPIPTHKMDTVAKNIDKFLKYNHQQHTIGEGPSFFFDDLMERMTVATRNSIHLNSAKYILFRNVRPSTKSPGKFYFDRDARLKCGSLECLDPVQILRSMTKVKIPTLLTKVESEGFFGMREIFNKSCDILKESNSDFCHYRLDGTHHLHLNNPEAVSHYINDFIDKYNIGEQKGNALKAEMKVDKNIYPMYQYEHLVL